MQMVLLLSLLFYIYSKFLTDEFGLEQCVMLKFQIWMVKWFNEPIIQSAILSRDWAENGDKR